MQGYQLAAGTIAGRHHVGESASLLVGLPNQDAIGFRASPEHIVATVHDGCSAGQFSEVGARIGAYLVTDCISSFVTTGALSDELNPQERDAAWEKVRQSILSRLYVIASRFSQAPGQSPKPDDLLKVVRSYFQFTTVGTLITPKETTIFSIGDGLWAINGTLENIQPQEFGEHQNLPPYLAYALINSLFDSRMDLLRFKIHRVIPTSDLKTVLIASDGLLEFVAQENALIPGKRKTVGPVSQLWESDRFFSKQFYDESGRLLETLTPFFRSLNSESSKLVTEPPQEPRIKREVGLIQDDLTVVSIRRAAQDTEGTNPC